MDTQGYRQGLSVKVVTPPAVEPVSVSEVQDRAGVTGDAALIGALITASRQAIEGYLDRALITQSLRMTLNGFPYGAFWLGGAGFINMPRAPLQSVASVKYFTVDDVETTYDSSEYLVLTDHTPGKIQVKYGQTWPTDVRAENVVTVDYVAGYGDSAADVPAAVRQAILLSTAEMYTRSLTGVASESIDNVSRSYFGEQERVSSSRGTGFSPVVLSLLDPFRVYSP